MAWVAPRTWTTADLATAAMLNQDLRDNPSFLHDPPAVRCTRGTAQSIPNNTYTTINWTNDTFDASNLHDLVSNTSRLTANISGLWLVFANSLWAVNGVGRRDFGIRKNGTLFIALDQRSAIEQAGASILDIFSLGATEYVEVQAAQTSGAALDFASSEMAHFGMIWLHG